VAWWLEYDWQDALGWSRSRQTNRKRYGRATSVCGDKALLDTLVFLRLRMCAGAIPSHIQIGDLQRVVFDKLAPGLDHVTH